MKFPSWCQIIETMFKIRKLWTSRLSLLKRSADPPKFRILSFIKFKLFNKQYEYTNRITSRLKNNNAKLNLSITILLSI